jgi:hypothetical protein
MQKETFIKMLNLYNPMLIQDEDIKLFENADDIKSTLRYTEKYPSGDIGGLIFKEHGFSLHFKEILLSKATGKRPWNEDSRMLDHLIENAFEHGNMYNKDKKVILLWDNTDYYIIDQGTDSIKEIKEGIRKRRKRYDEGDYSGTSYLENRNYEFLALEEGNQKVGTILKIEK